MTDFNTIVTVLGTQRIATAHASGLQVDLTQICVGDGNGDYYTLDPDQTELENQVWVDDAPTKFETFPANWSLIGDGEDIVVDGDANLVGGVVSLYCWYIPVSTGASVVAAA